MRQKILYISYDGMTDPLGQSQVLPYLVGLSQYGYKFTILSFEKKNRYGELRKTIETITSTAGIIWIPMRFTSKPPFISKFYDAIRMRLKALVLQRKYKFDMVHCRSYLAADIGLLLKKKFRIKFFFDMRGFWADEKKDGGAWNLSNPLFRQVYRYYKKKEAKYLRYADYIISLTVAGRKEMMTWPAYNSSVPIGVIPCCADMQLFSITDASQKKEARKMLGLPQDNLIISYLGSVGAWYMLDEMLTLFFLIKKKYNNAFFLFITQSDPNIILVKLDKFNVRYEDVNIVKASRIQVPLYTKASDINISFIQPVYSKISSSPTKLGEVLVMGIPIITNAGVGDVQDIITRIDGGFVLKNFSESEYMRAVKSIPTLLSKNPADIRSKAYDFYSLDHGIEKYRQFYQEVFDQK